jgi:hypothetical protein
MDRIYFFFIKLWTQAAIFKVLDYQFGKLLIVYIPIDLQT